MNERQYLFQELSEEVDKNYASIVVTAWSLLLNASKHKLSAPKIKSLNAEAAGMERAATLVLNNNEYLEPDLSPEKRLKRDKQRYFEAYMKDQADKEAL
jgi:hypothetical protein